MKNRIANLVSKILVAALISVNASASQLDNGGAHGGGGDPRDLKSVVLASNMLSQIQKMKDNNVKLQGDKKPDGMSNDQYFQYQQLLMVRRWFEASAGFFQITKTMRYPLTNPVLQSLQADAFTKTIPNLTFRHGKNLEIDGNRVTFISDPATQTVYVDYPRFKSFLSHDVDYDRYTEMSEEGIKMMTIALHEYLVLSRLEPSRSYRTSSTFAEPLTAMLTVEGFWLWAVKTLPFYSECPLTKAPADWQTMAMTKPEVQFLLNFIGNNVKGKFYGADVVVNKINENLEPKCAYLKK